MNLINVCMYISIFSGVCIYVYIPLLPIVSMYEFNKSICPVGCGSRIQRLLFCRGVRHPQ